MSKDKETTNNLIDAKDLLFIWRIFIRNILIIIILPIIAYGIGYIYSYRLLNIYGAKAELLLRSNETYDYQDPIYKGLGAYGMYMDVQNQIRIITSYDLISEVIDKVNIETSYFIAGRLKKQEVFGTLPFISKVVVQNMAIYERPVSIKILNKSEYRISYELNDKEITQIYRFGELLETPDFRIQLDKNYTFQEESMESIVRPDYKIIFHSRENLINKYRARLKVENIEYTSILSLSISDELQPRAKVFLDTLTQSYIDRSERVQLEVNQNTLENIEKQIDTVSAFIKEKEKELLLYKDSNFILDIEKEKDQNFDEYIQYHKDKRELDRRISSIESLREYLKTDYDDRLLPPSTYIEKTDIYLGDAIGKVREKQIKLEINRTQVHEEHLSVRNMKNEISYLKSDVIAYLNNLEGAIKVELISVNQFLREYESEIKSYPKSAQGILNIQRILDVNNKMYLFLLEKKTNTLITRAGIVPQVRIIEQTVGLGVVSPDKAKIKRLFLLGGIVLSLLIALIRNIFFERIGSVVALAESTDLTITGGVQLEKNKNYQLMIESNPKSHGTESFRTIRTNLSFTPHQKGKAKKVMISSFHPGEGKTFCSTNLGALIAKGEKKVLFIDFDLHRPKIHKVFELDNSAGASTFIIGKANMEEIIKRDIYPNLDVITSGPISPNPSELVLSEKVLEMIKYGEDNYDFVIIDTPPFGVLNDTFEIMKNVDVILVVVKAHKINKRGLDHISRLLDRNENVSKGLVLNGIKQNKFQYYYSKYGYNYSYNYGYGYGYGEGYTSQQEDN